MNKQTKQTRSEYVANVQGFTCAQSASKAPVKASKASGFTLGGIVQTIAVVTVSLIAVSFFF